MKSKISETLKEKKEEVTPKVVIEIEISDLVKEEEDTAEKQRRKQRRK